MRITFEFTNNTNQLEHVDLVSLLVLATVDMLNYLESVPYIPLDFCLSFPALLFCNQEKG